MSTSAFSQNSIYGDYRRYKNLDTITKVLKEHFPLDIDKDGKMDTIRIENVKDFEGDPEDFSEVKVKFGNGNLLTLKNVNGYFRDTSIIITAPILFQNTRITVLEGPGNYTSLLLNGYQYPSCENHIIIVSIMELNAYLFNDFNISTSEIHVGSDNESIIVSGVDHCTNEQKTFIHKTNTK